MEDVDLGGVVDVVVHVVVHDSALFFRRWWAALGCSLGNLRRFLPFLFYFVLCWKLEVAFSR